MDWVVRVDFHQMCGSRWRVYIGGPKQCFGCVEELFDALCIFHALLTCSHYITPEHNFMLCVPLVPFLRWPHSYTIPT